MITKIQGDGFNFSLKNKKKIQKLISSESLYLSIPSMMPFMETTLANPSAITSDYHLWKPLIWHQNEEKTKSVPRNT